MLAAGIYALWIYLGAIDEWISATGTMHNQDQGKLNKEVMSLQSNSGCTLFSLLKQSPTLLLPWLIPLSDWACTLLSSENSASLCTEIVATCGISSEVNIIL
jgi:hypothetical protein